jgi:hypothetical protein
LGLLKVIERPSNEVVLALPFRSQINTPVARPCSEQPHGSLDRAVKIFTLDRNTRPNLFAFDIEKTAFKFDHERLLVIVAEVADPSRFFIGNGL